MFMASAGILVANADEKVTKEEYDHIVTNLARTMFLPKDFLEHVAKQKVDELFEDSVKSILDYDPGLKPTLVEYVISVVMADSDINEEEVNFVYGFGQSIGLSVKEVSTIFADMFQKAFSPSISAIS